MSRIITYLLIWVKCCNAFFHIPLYIEFVSEENSSFGQSLAYQEKSHSLIVGAPHADQDGRVYNCSIGGFENKKTTCNAILTSENMKDLWRQYSRQNSPNQQFCLGASVAVTQSHLFACAPLVTGDVSFAINETEQEKSNFKAFGTCFIKDETNLQRYNGIIDADSLKGSVGWTTLVDQANDFILISKPSQGHIMYTSATNPLQQTVPVDFKDVNMQSSNSIGRALASGVFFSNYKTVYAFSMKETQSGAIAFLYYDEDRLQLITYRRNNMNRMVLIKTEKLGSLFGAALNAADFNQDGYSELLVGAPAQADRDGYENGAVYIYLGGEKASKVRRTSICIASSKDRSRFGTAIVSTDLDEDFLPELFVSAPYEDKGGAVYIISGFEIKKMLLDALVKKPRCTFLTKVPYQRISSESKSFGYILQPVLNYNEIGGNALAIGAPSVAKVFMYQSIPTINVTVSAQLKDKEIVRELDEKFTVTVEVNVSYPSKPTNIYGELIVTTSITQGVRATIENDTNYRITLLRPQKTFKKDIVVMLSDQEPRSYTFNVSVETDKDLLERPDFNNSLVRLSEYSTNKKVLQIQRRCKGDECVPRLSMKFDWMKGSPNHYMLGSSSLETLTVIIKNDGNSSYESCAKIKVTGAKIEGLDWNCYQTEITDECKFVELKGHSEELFNINLDMSQSSSKDEKLEVEVLLYNKCSSADASVNLTEVVMYDLPSSDISVNGFFFERIVTDREVAKATRPTIDLQETFTITNNGAVKWEEIHFEILLERQPYIQDFEISNLDPDVCVQREDSDYLVHNCRLTVVKYSTVNILITVNIYNDKIVENLNKNKLQMSSEIRLYLNPTNDIKNFTLVATVSYEKDTNFGNNKTNILIIAILLALIVICVIGVILYKVGFFKRTVKEELNELKAEARHRSFRQSCHPSDDTFELLLLEEEVAPSRDNEIQPNKEDDGQPNKEDEIQSNNKEVCPKREDQIQSEKKDEAKSEKEESWGNSLDMI